MMSETKGKHDKCLEGNDESDEVEKLGDTDDEDDDDLFSSDAFLKTVADLEDKVAPRRPDQPGDDLALNDLMDSGGDS